MKIVHLISSLGSGGAERQVATLLPEMASSDNEIHLIYCHGGPNLEPLVKSKVRLHNISSSNNYSFFVAARILFKILLIKPDLIQTWLPKMDILGGVFAFMLRIPFILSERSSEKNYPDSFKNSLRIFIGKFAFKIVANSEGGAAYWKKYVDDSRIVVIRNVISRQLITKKSIPDFGDDKKLVIYAGRLNILKNIERLIESLAVACKRDSSIIVYVFGEGPERKKLENIVAREQLQGVINFGGYEQNLEPWIRAASLFVSVSNYEGHPNVVIEAADLECPMVLSDIPAHREIFSEKDVYFVDKESTSSIADAVSFQLSNVSLASEMVRNAKKVVGQYDRTEIVNAYLNLYNKVKQ